MNKKKARPAVFVSPDTLIAEQIANLQGWYASLEGQYVLAEMHNVVQAMTEDVFGYYALELGLLVEQCHLLAGSRISHHLQLSTNPSASKVGGITKAEALPIGFSELDLIIACHILDYAQSPHPILREIERVLVPDGHCILISFNPLSLHGLGQSWNYLKQAPNRPSMYSSRRLRDWFNLLGFELIELRTLGFRPAFKSYNFFKYLSWLDRFGESHQLPFGSVQIMHVRKQVSRLIPIKPRLRTARRRLSPSVAVNRAGSHCLPNPKQRVEL